MIGRRKMNAISGSSKIVEMIVVIVIVAKGLVPTTLEMVVSSLVGTSIIVVVEVSTCVRISAPVCASSGFSTFFDDMTSDTTVVTPDIESISRGSI
ncbi:unnamed protein product [Rhizoctonia solani]|uniref:Uncharacterized protein n=1 Tax=Rhizoctonia solani TaxID=456999 RepID=A0A8H3DF20_9AGAM|nr:unnamed protein product [Rhizoctonia solani]